MKDEHNQEHDHLSQKEPEFCEKACKEQQYEEKQEAGEKKKARSRKILSLNIKKCTKNT